MTPQDERLKELARQVSRKKKLHAMAIDLSRQVEDLSLRVQELDAIRLKEQEDVDNLERASLSRLFYQFAGKLDEKLDKETAEAANAAVQYESASAQLRALQRDLDAYHRELERLADCERAYQAALDAKARELKARGSTEANAVCLLEEEIFRLGAQEQEIGEAISAGEAAMNTVEWIQDSLHHAANWGTWDLVGGGFLSDMAKHSHLDTAQQYLNQLQIDLRRFRTELIDVDVNTDFQISIDGFLRFADYFFDGIFADWAVMDRIHDAQRQVDDVRCQIQLVLEQLGRLQIVNSQKTADRRRQLEDLLLSSVH